MHFMSIASRAILLPLDPPRMLPTIFRFMVVPIFAVGALHNDFITRHFLLVDFGYDAGAYRPAAFAHRKP